MEVTPAEEEEGEEHSSGIQLVFIKCNGGEHTA